jgi:hypothetical protein
MALYILAGPALAQDCMIAPYWDPEGTISHGFPSYTSTGMLYFSVYVVIFAEDTVAAAAYRLIEPSSPAGPFLQTRFAGPTGAGLWIDEPEGTSVALTECVIGFGEYAVLVDRYDYVALDYWGGGFFSVEPHVGQDPDFPQYVDCNDTQKDCSVGPDLYVLVEFDTDARSFSAIKSLYHN